MRGARSVHTTHFLAAVGGDGRIRVWWTTNPDAPSSMALPRYGAPLTLDIGDKCSASCSRSGCCAGARLVVDPRDASVIVRTASIGLPAVYLYETRALVVVTTAPALIPVLLGKTLELDHDGIVDLLSVGYPKARRTLYRSTRLIPPASQCRVSVDRGRGVRCAITALASSAESSEAASDRGRTAFLNSLKARDLSNTVLSLTAGLDTRALAACLTLLGRRVSAVTLTGESQPSLDARIARRLCEGLGVPHRMIALDRAFQRELPAHVTHASLQSGGLLSVGGAHEVHFARQVRALAGARLSGTGANQLMRFGVEAVSARRADLSLLTPAFLAEVSEEVREGELHTDLPRDLAALRTFFLTHELPESLQGLFQIAHNYSVQQVPYADAALARAVPLPAFHSIDKPGPLDLRFRDIRHRFFGENHDRSLQVQLIKDAGAPYSTTPVNWGWTVTRGQSLTGTLMGTLAAADAMLAKRPRMRGVRRALRIEGLHNLYEVDDWFGTPLRDFVCDTLLSQSVRTAGVLDAQYVDRLLEPVKAGKRADYSALTAAIDVALAIEWARPADVATRTAAFGSFDDGKAMFEGADHASAVLGAG